MIFDQLQLIRADLRDHLRSLNNANLLTFHAVLTRSWHFLQENPVTHGILDDLERRANASESIAQKILDSFQARLRGPPRPKRIEILGTTDSEHQAISYWLIKKCVAHRSSKIEALVGDILNPGRRMNSSLIAFRATFVNALFDYISQQLVENRVMLGLLLRYKTRCEAFRRAELYAKWKSDTKQGEKLMATDLYQYLHDQGLQFHIEPQSASGRVDLISAQIGKDRLLLDAKILNPDGSQSVSYIVKGFRQIYDYTKDYNEPFGYLVIYKTCERDLSIPTPHQESAVPFVTHNNKTIFLLVIDIFDYPESASKRGKLKTYEITLEQLMDAIRESDIERSAPSDRS